MKTITPLDGIKVVEFAWMAAGPIMGAWLGGWGATIVRVESHTRIDHTRLSSPCKDDIPGLDRSAYFANWSSSKYGISLDLTRDRGRDIARRLITWADILTESFSAGQMADWGLDYEEVCKLKPDIIYLSTNQMGQTGPYSSFAGYGHHAAALSGITEISGWPDRDPSPPRGVYIDYVAPPFGLSAILACLDYRARTGKGAYIDLAQVETALQFIAPVLMDYGINGRIAGRNGNSLSYTAPHGVYPCKGQDNWVAITVFNDEEWLALRGAMGNPDWANDSKFGTLLGRKEHEDELDALMGNWTIENQKEDLEKVLQSVGIAAHAVTKCGELLDDPQLAHRQHFVKLDHPVIGIQSYEVPPFTMSKTSSSIFRAPCLGEHNEYVYKEILGLSDDEISELMSERVITTEADLPEAYI
ncbi:CaiB/BaiF CoA transferase family protein [Chloroflexota bacterium]